MGDALNEIIEEREKMFFNFGHKHDDEQTRGEIAVVVGMIVLDVVDDRDKAFSAEYADTRPGRLAEQIRTLYKTDYKKRLVVAAAMLLAEIERVDRLEKKKE